MIFCRRMRLRVTFCAQILGLFTRSFKVFCLYYPIGLSPDLPNAFVLASSRRSVGAQHEENCGEAQRQKLLAPSLSLLFFASLFFALRPN